MLRLPLILTLLTLSASLAFAQQDPQVSQNMHNKLYYNPAYAGMNDGICVYTFNRTQWVGFEGNPQTYIFGAHGTFVIPYVNLRSGGGLTVTGDGAGQMHFTAIKGIYSAHIPLNIIGSDPGHLGIGASVGWLQMGLGDNWRSTDAYYSDPIIPDGGFQQNALDVDLGLYYQTSRLYVGASWMHLNGTEFSDAGEGLDGQFPNNDDVVNYNVTFKMQQHMYFMAGYDFPLSNPLFVLKPMLFVKTDFTTSQWDVNTIVEYNNFIWGGLSWRYIDAVSAMAGVNWSPGSIPGTLRAGYAYDVTTSRIGAGSNGSHEIFVRYCLKLKQKSPVSRHKSVRFL